ncbi:phytase [Saccharopolyspora hirsuta]|uniref:Phytase n=1 Tax=Saccharopolyspora hirsuta TaxID=1837 RepID=A0A5M7BM68_SACHI|nr:phytase [Saccharopolyspora hirsuta]KAA5831246.1 phytase [Saccharopolyspora hirsuta]
MSATQLTSLVAAIVMSAGTPPPVPVTAHVETPVVHDDEAGGNADADDPAVWVDPQDPGRSIVIGTLKEAGLDVYDLDGRRLQHVAAPEAPGEQSAPGRFNNVDVVYGFDLGGVPTDLALVSDRGRDRIRAFAIDPAAVAAGKPPLVDVTAPDVAPVFAADEAEVDEQRTAYGLTAFRDDDDAYVLASQREKTSVRLLKLEDRGGRIGYRTESTLDLPDQFTLPNGTSWTPCADPGERPQVEGMAVDLEEHVLYAAQEAVGVWRVELEDGRFEEPKLIDRVREYGTPWTYDPAAEECVLDEANDPGFGGDHLSADAEGITIYHAGNGAGYVLASSQGDNTFAVYERSGGNAFVGSFAIADGATDGVQHSDGSTVVNVPLGGAFPQGLLVTHDGEETPADREGTNFKLTRWDELAAAFPEPLVVDTESFDPRR